MALKIDAAYHREWYAKNQEKVRKQKLDAYYKDHDHSKELLRASAKRRCASCSKPLKDPQIDHDHADNKIRGLLCRGCNTALGHVGDSVGRLYNLISYLEKFNGK